MDEQQYVEYVNDIKQALMDDNVDQTPEQLDRLIEQNMSQTQQQLAAQRAHDRELLVISERRRREVKQSQQLLEQENKQLQQERELFEQKKQQLTQEQQQYFAAFLEEQIQQPTRVGNKLIIEQDQSVLDMEREHLLEQYRQLEHERDQLRRDQSRLTKQKQKTRELREQVLTEQQSMIKHQTFDADTLDTHMQQLKTVCEQLQQHDPRLSMLPRHVMKCMPGVFREQLIQAYDMVLTALHNLQQMTITDAYRTIEHVNNQTPVRPDTQQTVSESKNKTVNKNGFDYDLYRENMKRYHDELAERHVAEIVEQPENASLLESYQSVRSNHNAFMGIMAAKHGEMMDDGGISHEFNQGVLSESLSGTDKYMVGEHESDH